jgi:hypothetical protein
MKDKEGTLRPWLFRGIGAGEGLGLLTGFYELASSYWLTAATEAAVIIASYALFSRWFPAITAPDDGSIGRHDGGDRKPRFLGVIAPVNETCNS